MKNKQQRPKIEIISAEKLDDARKNRIIASIAGEDYEVEEHVAPEILGGFVARKDSTQYDFSVQGHIKRMGATLRKNFKQADIEDLAEASSDPLERNSKRSQELLDSEWVKQQLSSVKAYDVREVGEVQFVADGVCYVDGLPSCKNQELLLFGEDQYGLVMNLEDERVGVVLLDQNAQVRCGDICMSTGRTLSVPTGSHLLGRIVNPLGEPLDERGDIEAINLRPIEAPSASIIDRQAVNQALYTGITAIDAMIPIGRGQRELIIGDRRSGKTSIAAETILNQKGQNVACIYVAIGQRMSAVSELVRRFRREGAMEYTSVVIASASDSAAMQYIAPYAATAMAEGLMYNEKRDVLIVYDDLSKHAVAYRAISLLLRRPPGREAYPGDIFYIHSRLLERALRLSPELGSGSITALPIIETQNGNISAFVPTNVISITDGQIFLDTEKFFSGQRPAVSEGLSVSRVGGAAQSKAMKKVAGSLRLTLSQAQELEAFSRLNSESDSSTQAQVRRGRLIKLLLNQGLGERRKMQDSVFLIYLCNNGYLDEMDLEAAETAFKELPLVFQSHASEAYEKMGETGQLSLEIESAMLESFHAYLNSSGHEEA
ncbi:MAG: F0F1 ATP synthase subunit alpha [Eubacteriales bacterium]|nr:F0F1 ATP synthase subunit alpha [Eubacteriales bacterium]